MKLTYSKQLTLGSPANVPFWITLLIIAASPIVLTSCNSSASAQPPLLSQPAPVSQDLPIEAEVELNGERFQLEVARTPRQQQIGLMQRSDLPADRGMIFLFDPPKPASFWMFNTLIPLDMLFVLEGQIVYIAQDAQPCPERPCPAYGPPNDQLVDQVLEFNAGTAERLGLQIGDSVMVKDVIPPSTPLSPPSATP